MDRPRSVPVALAPWCSGPEIGFVSPVAHQLLQPPVLGLRSRVRGCRLRRIVGWAFCADPVSLMLLPPRVMDACRGYPQPPSRPRPAAHLLDVNARRS